jgi:hypothetical protein
MSASLLFLMSLTACSNGWFGGGKDPEADTSNEADADTDADADSDSDSDADSDTDTDADTDIDPDKTDDDGDGYTEEEGDCDDDNSNVGPGETEVAYDGLDNDCDPSTPDDDLDGDGYNVDEDCDDTDDSSYPGAAEDISDGVDNDCDGDVDERFDTEVADSSCDCGYTSVVDVDSLGGVHVAYLNADTGELTYSQRTGSSWGSSTVISGNSTDWAGLSLDGKMDNADQFQVAYSYHYSSGGSFYDSDVFWGYRDSSGTWDADYLVDGYYETGDSYDVGNYVSLSVDSSNIPAFLYQDYSGVSDLGIGLAVPKIRTFQDFSLVSLDISSALDINYSPFGDGSGYFTDISRDSSDVIQTVWFDSWAEEVQYLRPKDYISTGAFSAQETVWEGLGYWTSLATKSDDTPCVAFQDATNADVMYGCRNSSTEEWSIETVDSSGSVGQGTQLAFNSQDEPYIVYYNETSGALRMSHHDGSSWSSFQVDGVGGDVGQYPSIAIDSSDTVHVTYYDVTNGYLLYAVGE